MLLGACANLRRRARVLSPVCLPPLGHTIEAPERQRPVTKEGLRPISPLVPSSPGPLHKVRPAGSHQQFLVRVPTPVRAGFPQKRGRPSRVAVFVAVILLLRPNLVVNGVLTLVGFLVPLAVACPHTGWLSELPVALTGEVLAAGRLHRKPASPCPPCLLRLPSPCPGCCFVFSLGGELLSA